jgi:hypothetical protein
MLAGVIALVFSLFLLISPNVIKQTASNLFDGMTFSLEEKIEPYRIVTGITLIIASFLMLYYIANVQSLLYFYPIWILVLVYGVLYVFFPTWLKWLTGVMNINVLQIDGFVMKFRKSFGIIILCTSLYIFYVTYLLI